MTNKQQLNNSLCTQLSNVAMLFNAAYAFTGKHIAVIFIGQYPRVELAERTKYHGAYDNMDCYDLAELHTNEDVINAIRMITDMHIELAL